RSALDSAIDEAKSLMEVHLARGDQVGLCLMGTRRLAKINPGKGSRQAARMLTALTLKTHTADADRSDWDDVDVARRMLEHASSIHADASSYRPYEHEKLAELALQIMKRAPVRPERPWSTSATDRVLRQYLLAFGIQPPPRGTSDRHHVEREIALFLHDLRSHHKPPTAAYLLARPP